MGTRSTVAGRAIHVFGVFVVPALFAFGCKASSSSSSPTSVQAPEPTPTDTWTGLLALTPHPYTTPLPSPVRSPVDGTYAKVDPSPPQWWACRRCAEYRPAGGAWKINFDRGVMHILYGISHWRSLASFELSGDRMYLFNDVMCPEEVGEYLWTVNGRSLTLQALDDACAFGLRAENLTHQTWLSCSPPYEMAAESDPWQKPPGCEPQPPPKQMLRDPFDGIRTNVFGGIARKYEIAPRVMVAANPAIDAPEGIQPESSTDSIPYGRNIVLWKEGDWVQTTFDLPLEAVGVQFHGDHMLGWASVYFDGIEVWRGDTSEIWSYQGRYGGYIQVSGFEPGVHTLRVEALAVDYKPVTIEFFGFGEVRSNGS